MEKKKGLLLAKPWKHDVKRGEDDETRTRNLQRDRLAL